MTAIRANFSDILAPGLAEVVALAYREHPDEYTKIFNTENSSRQYEKTTTIEGIGIANEKVENVGVTYGDLTQGYDKTYTHLTYGKGFQVTREMYDDDLYGVMKKAAQYLGRSIKLRLETGASDVFNNGFSSSYTGGDGKELFATDHPFASGGTGRNELSTAADLSQASLQLALSDIESTVDSTGAPINLIAKTLLVPSELRWDASVILESQLKSGTANNDKNVFQDLDLNFLVNHYLTDADAWFVLCDQNNLKFYMRQRPKFENDDDFDTGNAKFKATCRFSTGWADWIGTFGSPGA